LNTGVSFTLLISKVAIAEEVIEPLGAIPGGVADVPDGVTEGNPAVVSRIS